MVPTVGGQRELIISNRYYTDDATRTDDFRIKMGSDVNLILMLH